MRKNVRNNNKKMVAIGLILALMLSMILPITKVIASAPFTINISVKEGFELTYNQQGGNLKVSDGQHDSFIDIFEAIPGRTRKKTVCTRRCKYCKQCSNINF